MVLWITIAAFIALPLALHQRGATIVSLSSSIALSGATIIVAVTALLAIEILPLEIAGQILTTISLSGSSNNITYQDTYYIVANLAPALSTVAVFGTIAGVFWGLDRWKVPLPHRLLKQLFCLLVFCGVAAAIAREYFISLGMPRQYNGYDSALESYRMIQSSLLLIVLALLAALLAIAIYSAIKRLHTNAL